MVDRKMAIGWYITMVVFGGVAEFIASVAPGRFYGVGPSVGRRVPAARHPAPAGEKGTPGGCSGAPPKPV